MNQKNIVVLILYDEFVETWGSIKEACSVHGWNYNVVSRKQFPCQIEGWTIHRVPYRKPINFK